jgi:hypothetical protein
MEPKEYDFEFPRGDTCPYMFELTDEKGRPLNITSSNSEITMTVRDSSKKIVFQKKLSRGEISISNAKVSLVIEHNDTKDLKINGKYSYDIQLESGTLVKTMIVGIITLTKEESY